MPADFSSSRRAPARRESWPRPGQVGTSVRERCRPGHRPSVSARGAARTAGRSGGGPVRSAPLLALAGARAAAAVLPLPAATASPAGAASPAGLAAVRAKTLSAEQQRATTTGKALGLDAREGLRVRDVVQD